MWVDTFSHKPPFFVYVAGSNPGHVLKSAYGASKAGSRGHGIYAAISGGHYRSTDADGDEIYMVGLLNTPFGNEFAEMIIGGLIDPSEKVLIHYELTDHPDEWIANAKEAGFEVMLTMSQDTFQHRYAVCVGTGSMLHAFKGWFNKVWVDDTFIFSSIDHESPLEQAVIKAAWRHEDTRKILYDFHVRFYRDPMGVVDDLAGNHLIGFPTGNDGNDLVINHATIYQDQLDHLLQKAASQLSIPLFSVLESGQPDETAVRYGELEATTRWRKFPANWVRVI